MSNIKFENVDTDDIDGIVAVAYCPDDDGYSYISILYNNGHWSNHYDTERLAVDSLEEYYEYLIQCFEKARSAGIAHPLELKVVDGMTTIDLMSLSAIGAIKETKHSAAKMSAYFHGHETPYEIFFQSDDDLETALKQLKARLNTQEFNFTSLKKLSENPKYQVKPNDLAEDFFSVSKHQKIDCDVLIDPSTIIAITTEQKVLNGKAEKNSAKVVLRCISQNQRTHFDIHIDTNNNIYHANRIADAISSSLTNTAILSTDPFIAADPEYILAYKPKELKDSTQKFISSEFKDQYLSKDIIISIGNADDDDMVTSDLDINVREITLSASSKQAAQKALSEIETNQRVAFTHKDFGLN